MYRVLLVDDEPFIVEGLQDALDWSSFELEIAGTAGSGRAALELLRRRPVDLLITDITMPGMSGLELIREARKLLPELKVIILSGYNEFDYLKEGMSLGIENYLLKPVSFQELRSTLSASVAKLSAAPAGAPVLSPEEKGILRDRILFRWMRGDIDPIELGQRAELLRLPLGQPWLCAATARHAASGGAQARRLVDETLGEREAPLRFSDLDGDEVLLFLGGSPEEARARARAALERLAEADASWRAGGSRPEAGGAGASSGAAAPPGSASGPAPAPPGSAAAMPAPGPARPGSVSGPSAALPAPGPAPAPPGSASAPPAPGPDPAPPGSAAASPGTGSGLDSAPVRFSLGTAERIGELEQRSYAFAKKAQDYHLLHAGSPILDAAELRPSASSTDEPLEIGGDAYSRWLLARDTDALFTRVDDDFLALQRREGATPELLKSAAIELVVAFRLELRDMKGGEQSQEVLFQFKKSLDRISRASALEELTDAVKASAHFTMELLQRSDRVPIVSQVVQHVAERYAEPLSLKSLGATYHIHPAYLGQLFAKETGAGFTDYLNRYRIERAKDKLRTTDDKVADISQEVGYVETGYFYKQFKKYVGLSPNEYRELR
ncbi:response regulator [Paenibacillus albicereus]|uniref:Response regulator n=1 Tax=Paenibacillus albicereus TaxID=2726185 RepID=A0A6H2GT41_9BACL|nr:response regulator [Paenibacillus albicereus]QJC50567.1 response regulator [Paenibacillus albicereus]